MTGPAEGDEGAGPPARVAYRNTPPLADRPPLTSPAPPPPPHGEPARPAPPPTRPAGPSAPPPTQPTVGLAGLTFVVPLFFVLAFGAGDAESSLLVLGPLTTFALPVIAMIAFWWQDWPGSALRAGWSGFTDTVLAAAGGVALTVAAQAVVGRVDLRGVFFAHAGPAHSATFPVTLSLGAGAFVAILQLTLVSEGWPLRRFGRIGSGVAALALCWAVAVAAYLLLVNLDEVPAAVRGAGHLRNPGGPLPAAAYGALLIVLGVWQVILFVALRGWPFSRISRRGPRLLAGNAAVLAGTAVTFLLLREATGWRPNQISAAGGTVIAATLLVAMLFEGWPGTRLGPGPGRLCVVLLAGLVAAALYAVLAWYAGRITFARATAEDWIALAALNFLATGVVLHVAVWRRWPVVATTTTRP
ncbi:hypothetical protein [Micromonospora sp. URMC 103]|uniref:hypothetical protein n=1 Tax=Micromonospora sp. URMC 103 TaxID=3423406 RepID=UPI003F1C29E3